MYIGNDLQVAESGNKIIDDISSSFNGSTTSFALTVGGYAPVPFPINTQQIYISVNGVLQEPDPSGSAGFKLLGTNIVFSSAPGSGQAFFGVILSGADYVTVGTEFPAGSATAPSITFGTDNNTGLYSVTSGQMGFTSDGVQTFTLDGDAFRFNDNKKLLCGTGGDLEVFHDGSNSYIKDVGTGGLRLCADEFNVKNAANNEVIIRGTQDAGVELYFNATERFETTNTGTNTIGIHVDDGATHDGDVTCTGAAANVVWDKSVDDLIFNDNAKAVFGTSSDFKILHDGTDSYLDHSLGSGLLRINAAAGSEIRLTKSGPETLARFIPDGAVELYYDNSKKCETQSDGFKVDGALHVNHAGMDTLFNYSSGYNYITQGDDKTTYFRNESNTIRSRIDASGHYRTQDNIKLVLGTGEDCDLFHDGTNTMIDNNTGDLKISSPNLRLRGGVVGVYNEAQTETMLLATADGAVELYYNNAKKFETTADGVTCPGYLQVDSQAFATGGLKVNADNQKLRLGASDDLELWHDGSNSYIATGGVGSLYIRTSTSDNAIKCVKDGEVQLYYDGSKVFETTSTGVKVTSLGSSNGLDVYHSNGNKVAGLIHGGSGDEGALTLYDSGTATVVIRGELSQDIDITTGGNFDIQHDGAELRLGADNDLRVYHNGTNAQLDNNTGDFEIRNVGTFSSTRTLKLRAKVDENSILCSSDGSVALYHDNVKQAETTATGLKTYFNSPYVMLGLSSNQTVTNASELKINWTNESIDRSSNFDSSNERFTAPIDGDYLFCLSVQYTTNVNQMHTGIKKNATNPGGNFDPWVNWGDGIRAGCTSAILSLAANDYVELFTYQNTGSDQTLETNRCKATIRFLG